MKYFGETREVLNEFRKDMLAAGTSDVERGRFGTKDLEIVSVEFLDKERKQRNIFKRGESLRLRIVFNAKKRIESPEFSVGFYAQDGTRISYPTTRDHNVRIGTLENDGEINYFMKSIPLNIGKYFISVGCWDSSGHIPYDQHERLYEMMIEDGVIEKEIHERFGYVHLPATWMISNGKAK